MLQYIVKVLVTAVLVVLISEAAKKSTLLGSIIASLPLTSLLAIIWLYFDTQNIKNIIALSQSIFWVVIPSLVFFLVFPLFLKFGFSFWLSLVSSIVVTATSYWGYIYVLTKLGVKI